MKRRDHSMMVETRYVVARLTSPLSPAICAALESEDAVSGTIRSSEGLDARRRKALFRSWHRGMREMDLVLGTFADASIETLTDAELDQYERLLTENDTDLLAWVTGERPVPSDHATPLFTRICAYRRQDSSYSHESH